MKKSSKRKINLALSVVFVVQVAGVAFIMIFNAVHERRHHRDLLATDALTLQFAGPENIELQDPHAYARKGGLVVSGCLNRRAPAAGPVTSQVDIKLLSPKANVLDQTTIRDLSRCKRGGVHFSTRFSVMPSDGSVLAVTALADQEDVSKRGPASPGP